MPLPNRWILFILLVVAGFLAFSGWSFYRAANEASAVTDRHYYSHGLKFNQTLLEQQAAAALGWVPEVSLHDRQLRVRLHDQQQQPVAAAQGMLTLSGRTGGEPLRLQLREAGAGSYLGDLPAALHGEQALQLDFERNGVRLSRRLLLSLP